MRVHLNKKEKYLTTYADVMYRKYVKSRYGIEACKPAAEEYLAYMRKELVGWESNEDEGALSEVHTQYTTFHPVNYRDGHLTVPMLDKSCGTGYSSTGPLAPHIDGAGLAYTIDGQNVIQVNTGGCITRINLSPSVYITPTASFVFTQATPATIWNITHSLNMIPNVRTEDIFGNDIEGIIEIIDNNRLKIYFTAAVAGKAYLS